MAQSQNPIGRLVSAKAKPASASAVSIAGRQPVVEVITLPVVVACAGVLGLLLLAGLGVYFSIKQKNLRANHSPAPSAPAVVVVQNPPGHEKHPTSHVAPKTKIVEPSGPVNSIPVVQHPTPNEPPPLPVPPREVVPEVVAEKLPIPMEPRERVRPEATLEPPPMPKPEIGKVKPDADPKGLHFGTRIDFWPTPFEAYEQLKKHPDKLAMIVHYGDNFENGRFVNDNVEVFRSGALLDNEVANFVNEHFICSTQKLAPMRAVNGGRLANVVTYFCRSDGSVLHAIGGPVDAKKFLREAEWVLDCRKNAVAEMRGSITLYANHFKKVHKDRYFEESGEDDGPLLMKRPGGMKKGPGGFMPGPGFMPIPGGFLPPGFPAFPGFGDPVPPQPRKFPSQRPTNASVQAQIHWLLATRHLPKLTEIDKLVYPALLKERGGE